MAEKIKLVQGDTGPQIRLTITDDSTGDAIDLRGATVQLHVRAVGTETISFTNNVYVNNDTAQNGQCVIVWEEGQLDVEEGDYEGEIEVVTSSGQRQTIYDPLKFKIRKDFK